MGIVDLLLGTPKIVETAAEAVKGGISMLDNAFYTDQEKADNANKAYDVWLKLQMILANDNSIASVTRRFIALFLIGAFTFLIVFAALIYKFDKDWAIFILKVIIDGYLGYLVLAVVGTMFSFYGLGKYVSKDNVPFSTASIDQPIVRERPVEDKKKPDVFPETSGKVDP